MVPPWIGLDLRVVGMYTELIGKGVFHLCGGSCSKCRRITRAADPAGWPVKPGFGPRVVPAKIRERFQDRLGAVRMGEHKREVLVVDDDWEVNWQLGRALLRAGYSVMTCLDGEEAISVLTAQPVDAVVTDLALPRCSGLAITDWVRKNRPEIPVVAMTGIGSPMMKELSLIKGALHYLEKPVDSSLLIDILAELTKTDTFRGTLNDLDLLDYLQLAIISGKQVLIEVVSSDGQKGLIFVDRGKVLHACCGALTGEEAFYRCANFKGGRFANLPWVEPEVITVNKPGEFLLFQAARLRDEARADALVGTD